MDGGDSAGGSTELARLIDRYGEILVADLLHYYGVDLRDVFVPGSGLSARRAMTLIKYLPMESAFVAERRGGQHFRGWDEGRYINVAAVNALRGLQHTYVSAHAKNKPKAPEPFPVPDKRQQNRSKPGSFANLAQARIAAAKRKKEGG